MRHSLLRRFGDFLTRARPQLEKASSLEGAWTDREITRKEDDRFGFQDYAEVLAGNIRQAGTPITAGLFGSWGSGKTSLMRLIDAELKTSDNKVTTLWINVWQLASQDEVFGDYP